MGTLVDLTGRRFGRWFVTQRNEPPTVGNKAMWLCRCDCGVIKSVASNLLMHGRSLSCGCWNGDSKRTHGMSKTVEYRTWAAMKERCVNEGHASFDDYGGRGIQVCDRWLSSFETFYQDMGPRPSAEHSIERTDHNGNYEPGNCVWADWDTQANNRRNNVRFDYQGRNLTLSQCAEAMGVSKQTLRGRLRVGSQSTRQPVWDCNTTITGCTPTRARRRASRNGQFGPV
jgi:hypothetical protein